VNRRIKRTGRDPLDSLIMPQSKIVTEAQQSHPGKIYGQIHADASLLNLQKRRWSLMAVEHGDADALSTMIRNYQQALRR